MKRIGILPIVLVVAGIALLVLAGCSSDTAPRIDPVDAPAGDLEQWVVAHSDELDDITTEIQSIADQLVAAADDGDLVGMMTVCADAEDYLTVAAGGPAMLDERAPDLWREAIDQYTAGMFLCRTGNLDAATGMIGDANTTMEQLLAVVTAAST